MNAKKLIRFADFIRSYVTNKTSLMLMQLEGQLMYSLLTCNFTTSYTNLFDFEVRDLRQF